MKYLNIDKIKDISSDYNLKRFWSKVILTANNELCWIWDASKDKDGYGLFRIENKNIRANRLSFFLYYRIDPCDNVVCHKCDNPTCVNPSHLFLGSHRDNINDCWSKGRKVKTDGSLNGMAILSESQVIEIITLWGSGKYRFKSDIAKIFGVSQPTVSEIINRKTWTHIKI
jgi:predicted XRE-type DNA-binding protein